MTMTTTSNVDRYAAAEEQTVFAYTFRVDRHSDMEVSVDGAAQGGGYTVSNVGRDTGGNVAFATAPRRTGEAARTVTLRRVLPLTQSTSLPRQGALDTGALEAEADRAAMRDQQLDEAVRRTFKLPVDSTLTDVGPPGLEGNAGRFLGVNATEDGVFWGAPTAGGAPVGAFMETLMDDPDAAAALRTLRAFLAGTAARTAAFAVATEERGVLFLCDAAGGGYAAALPAAASAGDGFAAGFLKTDGGGGAVAITPAGGDDVDGLPDLELRRRGAAAVLVSDGSRWRLASHANVAVEHNAVDNASFLVDQYDHVPDAGRNASRIAIDRWRFQKSGDARAAFTVSREADGGIDGKSNWLKALCATADAAPAAGTALQLRQGVAGNDLLAFARPPDGTFAGGVLSMDVICHASASRPPHTVALGLRVAGGTREYVGEAEVGADGAWERAHIVIPADAAATLAPSADAAAFVFVGLHAGPDRRAAANAWGTYAGDGAGGAAASRNWAGAAGDYLGFTNVKLQPGQIATPYVPRSHAEELRTCQRYAFKFRGGSGAAGICAVGQAYSSSAAQFVLPLPTELRAAGGAVTVSGASHFDAWPATLTDKSRFSSLASYGAGTNGIRLNGGGASRNNLAAGDACLLTTGAARAYIHVEADIS